MGSLSRKFASLALAATMVVGLSPATALADEAAGLPDPPTTSGETTGPSTGAPEPDAPTAPDPEEPAVPDPGDSEAPDAGEAATPESEQPEALEADATPGQDALRSAGPDSSAAPTASAEPSGNPLAGRETMTVDFGGSAQHEAVPLYTAEDLQALSLDENRFGYYYLANDIDLSELGASFAPIGTEDAPFAGGLDGKGFTVTLGTKGSGSFALFGFIASTQYLIGFSDGSSGTVQNLVMAGNVRVDGDAAAIALETRDARFDNCQSYASVTSTDATAAGLVVHAEQTSFEDCKNGHTGTEAYVVADAGSAAGLCAHLDNGSEMSECANYVSVTGHDGTAGLCSKLSVSTIDRCANYGSVRGWSKVGGVVAHVSYMVNYDCYLTRCENRGAVKGTDHVGGVVGVNDCGAMYLVNRAHVEGDEYVGGVIGNDGSASATEYAVNYGVVKGARYVGGVIGDTATKQFSFKVDIGLAHGFALGYNLGAVEASGDYCGGVIGRSDGNPVSKLVNEGSVVGANYVGGCVGYSDAAIYDAAHTGSAAGDRFVGGITGHSVSDEGLMGAYSLVGAYVTGTVEGSDLVGILFGQRSNSNQIDNLECVYYSTDVQPDLPAFGKGKLNTYDTDVEGLPTKDMVGYGLVDRLSPVSGGSWVFGSDGIELDGGLTKCAELPQLDEFMYISDTWLELQLGGAHHPEIVEHDFDAEDDWNSFEPCRLIENYEDFEMINLYPTSNFVLMVDIGLTGLGLEQLVGRVPGGFQGKFDGMGRSVTMDSVEGGLFDMVGEGGLVENLVVKGTVSSEEFYTGGLADEVKGGTILNCENQAKVVGPSNIGGFVGALWDGGVVRGCTNNGAVGYRATTTDNNQHMGGIAALAYDPCLTEGTGIFDCTNNGAVDGANKIAYLGGIVGRSSFRIEGCLNTGSVTNATTFEGGIAGLLLSKSGEAVEPVMERCYNTGAVGRLSESYVDSHPGGIAGEVGEGCTAKRCVNEGPVRGYTKSAGIASTVTGTLNECANFGSVEAFGQYAGGITTRFESGSITECYNVGDVSVRSAIPCVAGIAGSMSAHAELRDCYNAGILSTESKNAEPGALANNSGGIATLAEGVAAPRISWCYYNTELNPELGITNVPAATYGEHVEGLEMDYMSGFLQGHGIDEWNRMEFSVPSDWVYDINRTTHDVDGQHVDVRHYNYPQLSHLNSLGNSSPYRSVPWPSFDMRHVEDEYMDLHVDIRYTGEPVDLSNLQFPGEPAYVIDRYVTSMGIEEKLDGPPTDVGYYKAYCTINEPLFQPSTAAIYFEITKAPLTLTPTHLEVFYGEPEPEYTCEGPLLGDDTLADALGPDAEVTYQLHDYFTGNTVTYDQVAGDVRYGIEVAVDGITKKMGAEHHVYPESLNYDVCLEDGSIDVNRDDAEGRYVVEGERGPAGFEDWIIGPATVRPTGADGYNLVSDDGGATWHEELTYDGAVSQTLSVELMLKKSATGATTWPETVTVQLAGQSGSAVAVRNATPHRVRATDLAGAVDLDAVGLLPGERALVVLEARPLAEADLDPDDLALLRAADQGVIGPFMDLAVYVLVYDPDDPTAEPRRVPVERLLRPVAFDVLFGKQPTPSENARVLRLHDGAVDVLAAKRGEDGAVSFSSDLFSLYALAYDRPVPGGTGDAGDAGGTDDAAGDVLARTGDPLGPLAALVAVGGAAGLACTVLTRRRVGAMRRRS